MADEVLVVYAGRIVERAESVRAKVSNSPTTHLCSQKMFTVLHLAAARTMAARSGFVHVPAPPARVPRREYPFTETMSIGPMSRAAQRAVRIALDMEARAPEPAFNH